MKIGILKTDTVRPEWVGTYGEYPDMFEALLRQVDPDLEFCTWDVEAGELPEDLSAVDGYIITGSKSSAYDDKPWIRALEDFIRHAHLVKVKLVGICFGHQLVARALGGLVDKSAKGWVCSYWRRTRIRSCWLQKVRRSLHVTITVILRASGLVSTYSPFKGTLNSFLNIPGILWRFGVK